MEYRAYFFILAFIISTAVGIYSIPRIVLASKKNQLFDATGGRKSHKGSVSRLGGLSFLPAIFISFSIVMGLILTSSPEMTLIFQGKNMEDIVFFMAGLVTLYLIGMLDDLSGMHYVQKFIFQFIAAMLIILPSNIISSLNGFLFIDHLPYFIAVPTTAAMVVLIINSYNLIDGADGLCSGLSSISIIALALLLFPLETIYLPLLAVSTLGVVIVFFAYNVFGKRLKIFMGDTGSLILGYVIAYMCLEYYIRVDLMNTDYEQGLIAIITGIVFVPVFDTLRVFTVRILGGKSPFKPDRNHVHHKLIDLRFSHIKCTIMLAVLQLVYIVMNYILSLNGLDSNTIILVDVVTAISINMLLNKLNRGKTKSKKLCLSRE